MNKNDSLGPDEFKIHILQRSSNRVFRRWLYSLLFLQALLNTKHLIYCTTYPVKRLTSPILAIIVITISGRYRYSYKILVMRRLPFPRESHGSKSEKD